MATITWRGGNGNWSAPTGWSGFSVPQVTDTAVLPAAGGFTVTLDSPAAAGSVSLGDGATLAIASTLTLAGTLAGAGAVALSGTLAGGTLDLRQGSASGGGALLGVTVLGGLGPLDGVTLDAATARLSAAAAVDGAVILPRSATLSAGRYGQSRLELNAAGAGATLALAGAVTIASDAGLDIVQDPAAIGGPASVTLDGAGLHNQGAISSNFANVGGAGFVIATDSFVSEGVVRFGVARQLNSGVFVTGVETLAHGGSLAVFGELVWTQSYAPTLEIASRAFDNSGNFFLEGGALRFSGAGSVHNSGLLWLQPAIGQTVSSDAGGIASVVDTTLATTLEVGAGIVDFVNSGTMIADLVEFDGAVRLADLGVLNGALSFDGTLDLGGGTLDASIYGVVRLAGLVENGTVMAGSGRLLIDGATLTNAAIAPGGDIVQTGTVALVDPLPDAPVTLDGVATRLILTPGGVSQATVVAGSPAVTDRIVLAASGTVTLGDGFSLTVGVPGSTVEVGGAIGGGPAEVKLDGRFEVNRASLLVSATLDGAGRIGIGNAGAVTLAALAVTARPTVEFGAGPALLTLPGSGALGVTLLGLHSGDVVDFLSISSIPSGPFGTGGAAVADGALNITGASGDTASLPLSGAAEGLTFELAPDGQGGSLLQVACFARGVRIATPGGDAPVESLRPGDRVLTADRRVAPVRWVGCTTLDLRRHPAPERAAPIRIRAGALAEGVPARDLLVSPEHCLLIEGALVPAGLLANGASIARDDGFARIEYWHVELDRHDALLAEGAAAESYLDTGNRALFAGSQGARALHPDLAGAPDAAALAVWAAHGCAPLRLEAEGLRARLRARAEALGWRRAADPSLLLSAAGQALEWRRDGEDIVARLPAGAASARLRSDSFVPREAGADVGDARRLGVAVRAALLAGWPLHPDAFAAGWHRPAGEAWRWTDGDATLVFPRLRRAAELRLRLGPPGAYWRRDPDGAAGAVGAGLRAA